LTILLNNLGNKVHQRSQTKRTREN